MRTSSGDLVRFDMTPGGGAIAVLPVLRLLGVESVRPLLLAQQEPMAGRFLFATEHDGEAVAVGRTPAGGEVERPGLVRRARFRGEVRSQVRRLDRRRHQDARRHRERRARRERAHLARAVPETSGTVRKARSVCGVAGCDQLEPCQKHPRKQGYKSPFYKSRAWQRIRTRFLAEHPRCEMCGAKAVLVDHIKPRTRDAPLGIEDVESNLQALCRICHGHKTVEFDGGYGRPKGDGRSNRWTTESVPD